MQWRSDDTHPHYTARQGTCEGLVWQHVHGDWAALVSRDGSAVKQDTVPTLEQRSRCRGGSGS